MIVKLFITVLIWLSVLTDTSNKHNLQGSYSCCRGIYYLTIDSNNGFIFMHNDLGPDDGTVKTEITIGTSSTSDSTLVLTPRQTVINSKEKSDTISGGPKTKFIILCVKDKVTGLKSVDLNVTLNKH